MQKFIKQIQVMGKPIAMQLLLGLIGIPVGIIIGAMDTAFGKILLEITGIRELYPLYLIPALPLAGILIAFCYQKFGGTSSKGMALIFEVGHGDEKKIPLRLIPFVVGSTWITHLFGGSAGREGVAVQIGATFSHWIGRHLPIKNAGPIFLVAGMAAGFSGLFGTPIAAVFFAMEVLVIGEMKFEALLPAFTASIAASTTSQALGLSKFTFILSEDISFSWILLAQLLLLGLIFGVVGGLFAWCLKLVKRFLSDKIKNPIVRIALVGVGLSALFLLLYQGRYSGLGTNLIQASFSQWNHIWLGLDFKIYINHCDSFSRISRRRSNTFVFNWSQPWSSHGRFVWSSCTICGGIRLRSCIRRRYKYLFGSNYYWRRNFRI